MTSYFHNGTSFSLFVIFVNFGALYQFSEFRKTEWSRCLSLLYLNYFNFISNMTNF